MLDKWFLSFKKSGESDKIGIINAQIEPGIYLVLFQEEFPVFKVVTLKEITGWFLFDSHGDVLKYKKIHFPEPTGKLNMTIEKEPEQVAQPKLEGKK